MKESNFEQELIAIRGQHDALRHAIGRLAIGVALVGDGQVVPLNGAADTLLPTDAEACFTQSDGSKPRRTTIAAIVAAAIAAAGPVAIIVTSVEPHRRLHLFAVAGENGSPAVLFLCDPLRKVAVPAEALHSLYAMTHAEARLASELANGSSVEEAARNLHITSNTARSHLKKVFAKTHTKRQGELVRLLAGTFAVLAVD